MTDKTVYTLIVDGDNIYAGTKSEGLWMRPLAKILGVQKK